SEYMHPSTSAFSSCWVSTGSVAPDLRRSLLPAGGRRPVDASASLFDQYKLAVFHLEDDGRPITGAIPHGDGDPELLKRRHRQQCLLQGFGIIAAGFLKRFGHEVD